MNNHSSKNNDIAIIGMACRFPDANNYDDLWKNLCEGKCSIKKTSDESWNAYNIHESTEDFCKYSGIVDDYDKFDASFFNISPREAKNMDPQQRILLEEMWHCIENAGITPAVLSKVKTSVYVGATGNDYDLVSLTQDKVDSYSSLGSFSCMMANRISHFLGLSGVSVTVDAACASSLIALHQAKQSIRNGESDYSIVAGVCLAYHPWRYIAFSKSHMMDIDGKCKVFDENANGFVQGQGVGVVLLEKYDNAIKQKHKIWGIVKGSAVNHNNSSITVTSPSVIKQKEVILEAYRDAKISPENTTYIEAHGTGTSLGDPIEIEALTQAFEEDTDEKGFCYVGSIKSNIGHTGSAAGIAGIIKVILMLQNRKIVKTINLNSVNPIINFCETPFIPATSNCDWSNNDKKLVAGISSFGFGGVNSHVIIEEFENNIDRSDDCIHDKFPFVLTAKTLPSLKGNIEKWKNFLGTSSFTNASTKQISRGLTLGRESFCYRTGFIMNKKEGIKDFIQEPTINFTEGAIFWNVELEDTEITAEQLIKYPLFLKIYQEIVDRLQREGVIIEEKYKRKIDAFIGSYILIKGIRDLGISIEKIIYTEEKKYAVFSSINSVDYLDMIKFLIGISDKREINVRRPDLPVFNRNNDKNVNPPFFSAEKLSGLIQGLEFDEKFYKKYVILAQKLYKNQYTFRKNIENWNKSSLEFGVNLINCIVKPTEYEANNLSQKISILFSICSLIQVGKKWNLKQKEIPNSYKYINSMLGDSLITTHELIEIILTPINSKKKIIEYIAKNKDVILQPKVQKKYTDLLDYSLDEIEKEYILNYQVYSQRNEEEKFLLKLTAQNDKCICKLSDMSCYESFILNIWKHGEKIEWNKIYDFEDTTCIALPDYSFDKKKYWFDLDIKPKIKNHMIDRLEYESDDVFIFNKNMSINDFYVHDHVVGGKTILPGVIYLELAYVAGKLCSAKDITCLLNVTWLKPLVFEDDSVIPVSILINKDNLSFEIFTKDIYGKTIHCTGIISTDVQDTDNARNEINFNEIIKTSEYIVEHNKCYEEIFGECIGFNYGEGFQVTQRAFGNKNMGMEIIKLPPQLMDDFKSYYLHPSLLDGALRTVTWIGSADNYKNLVMQIPFSLGKISVFGGFTEECFAIAELAEEAIGNSVSHYNVSIYNSSGYEIIRIEDFILRKMREKISESKKKQSSKTELKYYERVYTENEIVEYGKDRFFYGTLVLIQPDSKLLEYLIVNKIDYIAIYSGKMHASNSDREYIIDVYDDIFAQAQKIISNIQKNHTVIRRIIHFETKEVKSANDLTMLVHKTTAFLLELVNQHLKAANESLDYIYVCDDINEITKCMLNAFPCIKKSIASISNNINIKAICTDYESYKYIYEELFNSNFEASQILYKNGKRLQESFKEVLLPNNNASQLKPYGVYLISGGLGKVGLLCAKYLTDLYNATVILIGRRKLDENGQNDIEQISSQGNIKYFTCDITSYESVKNIILNLKNEKIDVNGIIHCAGITTEEQLPYVDFEEFCSVLKPKVLGIYNLDRATRNDKLDFFISFSSISAIIGDYCRGSYSVANKFLDEFTLYREKLVKKGLRFGHTISVNWPVWQDGGMDVVDEERIIYEEYLKQAKMPTTVALKVLENVLASNKSNLLVVYGEAQKIKELVMKNNSEKNVLLIDNDSDTSIEPVQENNYLDNIIIYVKSAISMVAGLKLDDIQSGVNLDSYGIDSIMILDLNKIMEKDFKNIPKTLFFEFRNIEGVAEYLCKNFKDDVQRLFGKTKNVNLENLVVENADQRCKKAEEVVIDKSEEDIAIVGIDGRFPMADDVTQLWENLKNGRDCITEIPDERWDHGKIYSQNKEEKNKVYCKWGGFINGYKEFDADFFGISPSEARLIDPQERLFLETVYHVLEDAGYTKEQLADKKVGVYVGVMNSHYQILGAEELLKGHIIDARSSFASIANRISYYFDFKGPSIGLDTMCSSSLTAIHLACESINNRECDYAIAGGVNLIIHPNKYVFLSEQKFGSSDGHCRAFGKGGDGYVPAEAVGAILLKPLHKAVCDGDHIYAVIKGTSINHGGRTNGYTVPNPNAQSNLVYRTLKKAAINPESISYIEAHGTGTYLGDPIEVRSLSQAFEKFTSKKQFCVIGSIKANIGHAEAAAGIASLIKVLLQIKYGYIVPSILANETNDNINFEDSPFYLEKKLVPMKRYNNNPLRACISSFGAGGANAHIIVEEYLDDKNVMENNCESQIVVLSAHTKKSLQLYAKKLKEYISKCTEIKIDIFNDVKLKISEICKIEEQIEDYWDYSASKQDILLLQQYILNKYKIDLSMQQLSTFKDLEDSFRSSHENMEHCFEDHFSLENLAYTLQQGREEFEYRKAFVVDNFTSLLKCLDELNDNNYADRISYVNTYKKQECINDLVLQTMSKNEISEMWEKGFKVNWQLINKNKMFHRLSLPGYPYNRKTFWLSQNPIIRKDNLIFNCSISYMDSFEGGIAFIGEVDNDNRFVKEHIINEQLIVPGVIQLETVSQCFSTIVPADFSLAKVKWVAPLIISRKTSILIRLLRINEDTYQFSLQYMLENSEYLPVMMGEISTKHDNKEMLDLSNFSLQERQQYTDTYDKEQIYESFKHEGINYGPYFQKIESIKVINEKRIFAQLENRGEIENKYFLCEPSSLDAALQSTSAFTGHLGTGLLETNVPYSVDKVVKINNNKITFIFTEKVLLQFNVYLLDVDYRPSLILYGVEIRKSYQASETPQVSFYQYQWKKSEICKSTVEEKYAMVLTCPSSEFIAKQIKEKYKYVQYQLLDASVQIQDIVNILDNISPKIDVIYYFDEVRGISPVEQNDLRIFNLLKALIKTGYNERKLHLKFITFDTCHINDRLVENPVSGFVRGFLSSADREFGDWNINYVDISLKDAEKPDNIILIESLVDEYGTEERNEIAYYGGTRYIRTITNQFLSKRNTYLKKNGVYVILGGSGGIGYELSLFLAKRYQAKIVWIGRSELDLEKKCNIKEIEENGGEVFYYQGDGSSERSMKEVISKIKMKFGIINGLIHAAVAMNDTLIINMSKRQYEETIDSKMKSSLIITELLKNESLDFIVFFSSIQTFYGNIGQSNYAAGCTFQDTYSDYLQKQISIPVKVIDWGFWGEAGVVSSDKYHKLLAKQGIMPISTAEGIDAFNTIMTSDQVHVIVLKNGEKTIKTLQDTCKKRKLVCGKSINNKQYKELLSKDEVEESIMGILGDILETDDYSLNKEKRFVDYGLDSVSSLQFIEEINNKFNISVKTVSIFEYPNITLFCDFIFGQINSENKSITKFDFGKDSAINSEKILDMLARGEIEVEAAYNLIGEDYE